MAENKINLIRIVTATILTIAVSLLQIFTKFSVYVYMSLFIAIYLGISYDIIIKAIKNISHGEIFDENFLMLIATIGAFAIFDFTEALAVMIFYQLGELCQDYAVDKSKKSITELMDIRPLTATLIDKDGLESIIKPEEVKVGETILIKAGEKVPIDGEIISGESSLNLTALTGESLPKDCAKGDKILSGAINLTGVLTVKADKCYKDSTVSKILELVENSSSEKSKSENFITKFARFYTPIVCALALLLILIPTLLGENFQTWLVRGLTFLVVSCPCALVISIPLSIFAGIGGASKKGILIKGGNYLELIEKANIFIFDKTGTLTEGNFIVKEVYPLKDKDKILFLASICEKNSNHRVATAIKSLGYKTNNTYKITELAGRGIKAEKTSGEILTGSYNFMQENNIICKKITSENTTLYVAENGEFCGYIEIGDTIKKTSKEVIRKLNADGAKTIMLTGDNEFSAKAVASALEIDEFKAELLPNEKVTALKNILKAKSKKDIVCFVGDGINDAPTLMLADIGVSMGGVGSDSAIEASDAVIMNDDLKGIILAQGISKKTMRIVKQNIIFAISIKIAVLILSALGLANMWLAVFADVGVSLLAILNAMRASKN